VSRSERVKNARRVDVVVFAGGTAGKKWRGDVWTRARVHRAGVGRMGLERELKKDAHAVFSALTRCRLPS
jgi:hypothetical protein